MNIEHVSCVIFYVLINVACHYELPFSCKDQAHVTWLEMYS